MLRINDLFVPLIYLTFILLASVFYQKKKILKNDIYKYFTRGLVFKLIGGIALCLIYTLYYDGGDTTNFFYYGGDILHNVFDRSPADFFSIVFGKRDFYHWNLFNLQTGWPYYYNDPNSFFVVRIVSVISLLTFRSYIATSILLTWICYSGVWRLLRVFADVYPEYQKELAISVLFIPSVIFWGSGILKDSVTFAAIGWYLFSFYTLFIKRKNIFWSAVTLIISSYILLNVKAYILYALLPGSLIWLSRYFTSSISIKPIKFIMSPLLLTLSLVMGYFIVKSLGAKEGKYGVNTLLERAVITQADLKRSEQYGNNFYDIGKFDASLSSVIKKTPIALFSALFRPLIWEVRNPLMLMSAIENLYFLYLLFIFLRRSRWFSVFKIIQGHPLIMFSLVFTLFFSFSVGLTSTNFGALVRYRIPALPFFVSSLFLCRLLTSKEKFSLNIRSATVEKR